MRQVRLILWAAVIGVIVVGAALLFTGFGAGKRSPVATSGSTSASTHSSFGGPFTLVGADGKPFSSAALKGKPYALYFGFTRCGDTCPTTLSRMVKLRKETGGGDKFNIVFVTIDPANDGPKEVGQYAGLFNAPIIGLTGSKAQIDRVKKQFGIYAEPVAHGKPGMEMEHTGTVLLFDGKGRFAGTIAQSDSDSEAIGKLKSLAG